MNDTLVPAMRYRDLEEYWSEHGRPCPALNKALSESGFVDWVERKVEGAVDDALIQRGLGLLCAEVYYDSEGDWYTVWACGNIFASAITDKEFARDITSRLGTHHHFLDLGRHKVRVKVREPIHDLDIEARVGDCQIEVIVDDEVTPEIQLNDGLRSAVHYYFENVNDRLGEVAIEEFYTHVDEYMKDENCWFLIDGTPCDEGDVARYVPMCKGQLRLFKEAA